MRIKTAFPPRLTVNRDPRRGFMPAALLAATCFLLTSREAPAARRYVNQDAMGENTGRDWAHAYTCLQTALLEANHPTSNVDEIWVAMGMYRPVRRTAVPTARLSSRGLARCLEASREPKSPLMHETRACVPPCCPVT